MLRCILACNNTYRCFEEAMKIKISNVSFWASITALAVAFGYYGWITGIQITIIGPIWPIYVSVGLWLLIGAVDLKRIKDGDMTISERIREATPEKARYPIVFGSWLIAFLIGGFPLLVFAVIYTTCGHWHWR
jgi:hypothetical protein